LGIEGLARGDDNAWADGADKKLVGRAWIVSPLQVRSVTIADQAQQQARQHFDYAPIASAPAGTSSAPQAGQSAGPTDLQSRDRFGLQDVEDLRLQSEDAYLRGTEAKDESVKAETIEQLGDRSDTDAGRTLSLGAATEPPADAPPGTLGLDGGAPTPQGQSTARKDEAQAELFSAKAATPATPQRPVRMVLFFNVLPAEPQPATATESSSD
jgi:hypothetical protein